MYESSQVLDLGSNTFQILLPSRIQARVNWESSLSCADVEPIIDMILRNLLDGDRILIMESKRSRENNELNLTIGMFGSDNFREKYLGKTFATEMSMNLHVTFESYEDTSKDSPRLDAVNVIFAKEPKADCILLELPLSWVFTTSTEHSSGDVVELPNGCWHNWFGLFGPIKRIAASCYSSNLASVAQKCQLIVQFHAFESLQTCVDKCAGRVLMSINEPSVVTWLNLDVGYAKTFEEVVSARKAQEVELQAANMITVMHDLDRACAMIRIPKWGGSMLVDIFVNWIESGVIDARKTLLMAQQRSALLRCDEEEFRIQCWARTLDYIFQFLTLTDAVEPSIETCMCLLEKIQLKALKDANKKEFRNCITSLLGSRRTEEEARLRQAEKVALKAEEALLRELDESEKKKKSPKKKKKVQDRMTETDEQVEDSLAESGEHAPKRNDEIEVADHLAEADDHLVQGDGGVDVEEHSAKEVDEYVPKLDEDVDEYNESLIQGVRRAPSPTRSSALMPRSLEQALQEMDELDLSDDTVFVDDAVEEIGTEIPQASASTGSSSQSKKKKNKKKTATQVEPVHPSAKTVRKIDSTKQNPKKGSKTYDQVENPTSTTQKQIKNTCSHEYAAQNKGKKWWEQEDDYDYYWTAQTSKTNTSWDYEYEYDTHSSVGHKKGKKGGCYDAPGSSAGAKKWRKAEQASDVEHAPYLKKGRPSPVTPKKYQEKHKPYESGNHDVATPSPSEKTKVASATVHPFSPKKNKNNANGDRRVDPLLVLPMSPKKEHSTPLNAPLASPKKTDWIFDSSMPRTACWADEVPYSEFFSEVPTKTALATTPVASKRPAMGPKRVVPEPQQIDSNGSEKEEMLLTSLLMRHPAPSSKQPQTLSYRESLRRRGERTLLNLSPPTAPNLVRASTVPTPYAAHGHENQPRYSRPTSYQSQRGYNTLPNTPQTGKYFNQSTEDQIPTFQPNVYTPSTMAPSPQNFVGNPALSIYGSRFSNMTNEQVAAELIAASQSEVYED